jgi:hypothetical protein
MAFEKLAPYIDVIEQGLKDHKSPRAIAKELGQDGLDSTIQRYKTAVWGLKDLVSDAKEARAEKHEANRNAAVEEIVNTLDLINLGKLRAKQLLAVNLGDEFAVSGSEEKHKLTLGSASIYWPIGTRMMTDSVKLEMELSADDPESRKASAMESWADTRLAILGAVDDDPEAKQRIIEALERRRRDPVYAGSGDLG